MTILPVGMKWICIWGAFHLVVHKKVALIFVGARYKNLCFIILIKNATHIQAVNCRDATDSQSW